MPHGLCLRRTGCCVVNLRSGTCRVWPSLPEVLQTVVFMAAACEGFITSASLGNFGTGAMAERIGSLCSRESGRSFAGLGVGRPKRAMQLEPAVSLSMSSNEQRWERPAARGEKDIIIGTRVNTNTHVQGKHDEGYGIGEFMRLPPEQYVLIPLPNNAKLERIGGSLFRLNVPELQLFNVWIKPILETEVIVEEDRVVITVTEALLEGSPEVQRLEINSKFEFDIRVILSTETDRSSLRSELMCKSEISVWVDVPVIFRAMFPKPLIEQTGNAVIFASLNIIQNAFVQGLADDYKRWSTDGKYREQRKSMIQIAPSGLRAQ